MKSPKLIQNLNTTLVLLPFDRAIRSTIPENFTSSTPNETNTCELQSNIVDHTGTPTQKELERETQ
jgi:hypothetical protein